MNNDPADERARARNALQLTRELEKKRKSLPHPGGGGTRGYAVWFGQAELAKKLDDFRRTSREVSCSI